MQHKFSILIAFCLLFPTLVRAQETDRAKTEFFEAKIRPALVAHCYECHSTKSGKSRGSLKVDSRDALLAGGDTGPAVVARSLEKSLLFKAITHDGDFQMPPKGKLPDEVIADFRKWILMGAPDPRVTEINPAVKTVIDVEKGREYWAYRPLVRPEPPSSSNSSWVRTPIDQFTIAKLDEHKLKPVDDAPLRLLVRRLYFVLTGLPPTPEEIEDWTKRIETQPSEMARRDALAELVDQQLESPQYGERWGRHWMDVARFAESTGGDQNNVFQHAWRYRDWVIDAFSSDKPYDQFIREQIAGDLLPIANDQEWADNVIATGFLAVGTKLVGEEDQQKFFADLVDEQIDATTRAFLATSVACARCHDHKFDPIPQSDYYALAGIFRSTETHYGLLKAQARQATTLLDLTGLGPPAGTPELNAEEYAALVKKRDDAAQVIADAMKKIRAGENVFRGLLRKYRSDRDETEAALQAYSNRGQPRVFAMGTQDRDLPLATRLLVRGELDKPAQSVPRGVLQVLSPRGKHSLPTVSKGSGRLELANWIASHQNPLTARVMSNRVWHWMFGRGLVRTVDDFGSTGDRPTHPELLDYLAIRFIQNGWSTKKLIREIALSRTWQLSTSFDEDNFAVDPDNQYLWRMHQRRLEGEAVRDAMLVVGGNLDLKRQPGTLLRDVGEGNVGQNVFEPVIRAIDSHRRSVYLPRVRGVLPEVLELFDAPDASLVAGSREQTSSPLQSLYLMNNPFVQRQAEGLSQRIAKRPPSEQIEYAYLLALGRKPREEEKQLANSFLDDVGSARLSTQQKLTAYCQALICTTEFCSID
ncbi:Planctomycete cytochrome C [Anatilimnocola aggregata]|uniref:Planctomycete cytochrome C n=1 Tax=Anatilimnocola aggregata TaxID=2528021 RepID=A0A517YGA2_9BACT|nr:PSD1 and planctomycete cytochrome C domain-containing protein [Anatilimnocola aggregata]QDU29249.1 Planctomycete cytochrome C [Anatilimnocola aggregata]